MNISPVSFGKLHIKNNQDNKDFLTMVCANKMSAPARQLAIMDWTSGNDDIYLKAQKANSDRVQFEVEISNSEGKTFAWETFIPSNSGNGLKSLGEQISKHYCTPDKEASITPEQLLDLYS